MRPLALLSLGALLAAGCASLPGPEDDAQVSDALVRLSDRALATADSGEDLRVVLRAELQAGPPPNPVVMVGGHRFLLTPATLDRLPDGRYRSLLVQSLELAEQTCLRFVAEGAGGFRTETVSAGSTTLASSAEGLQKVVVGIELHRGCIVALHAAQASPSARD